VSGRKNCFLSFDSRIIPVNVKAFQDASLRVYPERLCGAFWRFFRVIYSRLLSSVVFGITSAISMLAKSGVSMLHKLRKKKNFKKRDIHPFEKKYSQ